MKNHTSKKYNQYKHIDKDSRDSDETLHRHKNVLKERHYKEDGEGKERNRKKDKHSDIKHSSHSHKSKRSHSPHQHSHHKSSTGGKNEKHDSEVTETYEELSRKKRKLESELRALDLEEAAEREAENKKTRRERDKSREDKKHIPRVKEEPHSEEDRKPSRSKISNVKTENDRHRSHNSKSSADEKHIGWGKSEQNSKTDKKEKPNFAVSGKLAEDTNTYNGIVIKYNEPAEARKPKRRWRLYPFKGDTDLPFIPIHRQSAYLFGRTRLIADIPIDHPSCSKQHAVLQYRLVSYKREDGSTGRRVRPYIIDLESSNGTYVNNKKIEPRCYVELIEKDVIKFGFSSREYVLLHEESKNDDEDDNVVETND